MKANQPDLPAAVADAFDDEGVSPRERRPAAAERQTATSSDKGHGRRETRAPTCTTSLSDGHLDRPGLGQCSRLVRERTSRGATTAETACGITSPRRDAADAARLLKLVRQHWGVEVPFRVRDGTFGEGRCRVRSGDAPALLSALRNAAFTLLAHAGHKNKAAALRRHAAHPNQALAVVRGYG